MNKIFRAQTWFQITLIFGLGVPSLTYSQSISNFPNKPVRIIVGYTPGGSTDIIGRQIGLGLSKIWGQPVIVENRPGAGGNIGADYVAKSNPDGYTLLMWHDGLAANAGLYKQLSYDPIKDFAPVSTIARVSIVMGVANNFPAKTVKNVIEIAKNRPKELTYASCGVGTPHHIAGEMFRSQAQVEIAHAPYKGCSPALTDVVGGHVPIFFQTLSNVTQQMKSGQLRVLAVADATRLNSFPDLPTMVESGLPNFIMAPWYGIFAPSGTPKNIVSKISADMAIAVSSPEMQALLKQSYYRPETNTPDEFSKLLANEIIRLGKVISAAGMSAE